MNKAEITNELSGVWHLMTPIVWEATHNAVFVRKIGLEVFPDETVARHVFDAIAAHMAKTGVQMIYHGPALWLIDGTNQPLPIAPTADKLLHQSLAPFMTSLDKTGYWPRMLTEIQMVLHAMTGESQEPVSCNGVWVTSAGSFDLSGPPAPQPSWWQRFLQFF